MRDDKGFGIPPTPASYRRINVSLGPKEQRVLITGLHTVADIHCTCCQTVLGWKYVSALHGRERAEVGLGPRPVEG